MESAGDSTGRGNDSDRDRTGHDRNKDLKQYLSPEQVPSMLEKSSSLQVKKFRFFLTLRKHANSNTMKISHPKAENFHIKNSDIFLISAQNIDCGTR